MVERGADPTMVIQLAHELQKRIGLQPLVKVDAYSLPNESGIIYRILRIQPGSLSEITRAVRAARTMKLHIRCIGRGSSLNKTILMNDFSVVLDLSTLCDTDRIERVQVRMTDMSYVDGLRVLAGVTTNELCQFQVKNQISIPTNVESSESSVIGSIVSGCCGTISKEFGALADYVIQTRIIDIHGEIRTYVDNSDVEFDDSANNIKTVISGLGMLGVVYDVVLRYKYLVSVNINYEYLNIEYLLNNMDILKEKIKSNLSTQLIYIPFNKVEYDCDANAADLPNWRYIKDEVMVRTMQEVEIDSESRQFINIIDEEAGNLETILQEPHLTPWLLRQNFKVLRRTLNRPVVQYLPWAIHCFPSLSTGNHELTITLPFENNFHRAFGIILDKIQYFAHCDQNYSVNCGVRINFTLGSGVTLAPGCVPDKYERKRTIYAHIKVSSVLCSQGWQVISFDIMDEILREIPLAVLQWNTEWIDKPIVMERILELEGTRLDKLKEQIEIMDRDGVFLNYHLQKMFYPNLESYRRTYRIEQDEYLQSIR